MTWTREPPPRDGPWCWVWDPSEGDCSVMHFGRTSHYERDLDGLPFVYDAAMLLGHRLWQDCVLGGWLRWSEPLVEPAAPPLEELEG